jgi:hypothetical protein
MPNSEETVAMLMEQMDPDGSGTLDWEEFKILVKQVPKPSRFRPSTLIRDPRLG